MKDRKSISLKTIFRIWLIICYIYFFINLAIDYSAGSNLLTFLKEQPLEVLECLVFSLISTIFTNGWVLLIISIVKKINKKVKKENLSAIDFKQYEGYYREILNQYSPAEIEYIDNLKCDKMTTIIAILLKLELLRKIKVNEKDIEIIDSNTEDLRKTEKYILESIKDGKVKISNSGDIESCVLDEGIEDDLIKKFEFTKDKIEKEKKKQKMLVIVMLVLFVLVFNNVELIGNEFIKILLTIGVPIGMLYAILIYPISRFIYRFIKGNSYIRTDKGKEINEKIEGLKNYIIQYSSLETKEKEELILWEEYLIYSVIFKLNTKIIEDMSKLIEIEYETGRIYFLNKNQ